MLLEIIERHIFQPPVWTVCAPRVLHDEILLALIIVGYADDGHPMTFVAPTHPVVLAHGPFGLGEQRVHGDVQVAVVQPIVGRIQFRLRIIGLVVVAHQLQILPGCADAAGKFLRRVFCSQHKHVSWGGGIH